MESKNEYQIPGESGHLPSASDHKQEYTSSADFVADQADKTAEQFVSGLTGLGGFGSADETVNSVQAQENDADLNGGDPGAAADAADPVVGDPGAAADTVEESEDPAATIARLTDELARERAAFHNFRMARVKQAEVEKDRTRGEVVRVILPVLDDFDRAQKHGDLPDPFGAISTKLRTAVEKIGLSAFAKPGDTFDPNLHEALFQLPSDEVQVETILEVIEAGYRLGETVVRVAKVTVQVPNG